MLTKLSTFGLLAILVLCLSSTASAHETGLKHGHDANELWNQHLQKLYFGDRKIIESDDVITIEAPKRAEDPSLVPVSIKAQFEQSPERYIKTVTLLIDKNPVPFAGRFNFTPHTGRADLALRIRINEYSPVRAVAELNDGSLHMSQQFVKASGGCSAPIGADLEKAMARLGKMKIKVNGMAPAAQPLPTQLRISHPNITGLQMDQVSRYYRPPHFVKNVKVSFLGKEIFSAETDISISADPNFKFFFAPAVGGELVAEVTDNTGEVFTKRFEVAAREVVITQQVAD